MGEIGLRPVRDADLDALYDQMRDPEAVMMAAFTAEDPDDREAFDAHFVRLRTSPDILLRAITVDGELAGTIASFVVGGDTEITYWLDRAWWGRGVATRAVELLLDLVPVRPIIARAASDNAAPWPCCARPASARRASRSPTRRPAARRSRRRCFAWTGRDRARVTGRCRRPAASAGHRHPAPRESLCREGQPFLKKRYTAR
nr:hypothetical protein GCM10020092_042740 [Actinoplanes digitatis]